MEKYRAFISYSRQDIDLVRKIVTALEKDDVGVTAIWDQNFAYGYGFHEQIKSFIAHAHVFVPFITRTSNRRGWVHQEIGYAMALNIPVLPITLGMLPGEMIQQLHAIQLHEGNEAETIDTQLTNQLTKQVFDNLVGRFRDTSFSLYECAELAEDRSRMMADYAMSILDSNQYGRVRQKGGLSSFHIPENVISHPEWTGRYLPGTRSAFHRRSLRRERIALGQHARKAGCSLVVNPDIPYDTLCTKARILRLQSLMRFLADTDNYPDVEIAFDTDMTEPESLTIVGNWFSAESIAAPRGQSYLQTIFTRHAPSMSTRTDLFDQQCHELRTKEGWTIKDCRTKAIEWIKGMIPEIMAETCHCSSCQSGQ